VGDGRSTTVDYEVDLDPFGGIEGDFFDTSTPRLAGRGNRKGGDQGNIAT
jgi:hypothetical protein